MFVYYYQFSLHNMTALKYQQYNMLIIIGNAIRNIKTVKSIDITKHCMTCLL